MMMAAAQANTNAFITVPRVYGPLCNYTIAARVHNTGCAKLAADCNRPTLLRGFSRKDQREVNEWARNRYFAGVSAGDRSRIRTCNPLLRCQWTLFVVSLFPMPPADIKLTTD